MSKEQFESLVSKFAGHKVEAAKNDERGGRLEIRAGGYLFTCNGISITGHVNGRKLVLA